MRSIGVSRTYSPEMSSPHHNYITSHSNAVHKNSHGVAYTLLAFRCLWLKAHFAPEFWAAIMSDCHPEKLIRYMGVARTEDWTPTEITSKGNVATDQISKVQFRALDINNLQVDFSVTDNKVNQGLIGIKGIGESAAAIFAGRGNYQSLDDFISGDERKKKNILERFIKLDAFKDIHENSRALWLYYQYHHSSKKELDDSGHEGQIDKKWLESRILEKNGWSTKAIAEEIERQIKEYKIAYPKKKVIPNKILNWKPKAEVTLESLSEMFPDFSLKDRLDFQIQFIGYYLDNPMDMYETSGKGYIKDAIHRTTSENYLEGIIDSWVIVESEKTGRQFGRLTITDGVAQVTVFVWDSEIAIQDRKVLSRGVGVFVPVVYNADKNLFNLPRRGIIMKLRSKDR